jgi:hypothetical protein
MAINVYFPRSLTVSISGRLISLIFIQFILSSSIKKFIGMESVNCSECVLEYFSVQWESFYLIMSLG